LAEKPFWITWDFHTFKDFRLWTWLQATKALDLPTSDQAEIGYNYFSIESNQAKASERRTRKSLIFYYKRSTM